MSSISRALRIPIDFDHGYPSQLGGNSGAADAIRNASKTHRTILVAWEHVNIQYLTADLGVSKDKIPDWQGSDYDSVYVLELDDQGKLMKFTAAAQNYKPKSTTCDPAKYVPPPGQPGVRNFD